MNLSAIFIQRPIMTTLVSFAIFFFGLLAYFHLPVSDLPNVEYPSIAVSTTYPGASPSTMANNVVSPLEQQLLTIPGINTIVSTSSLGNATIVLQFVLSKSLDTAAQEVQAAINQAGPHLPQDLPYAPTYQKVNPSQSPIIWFSLTSPTMQSSSLYSYAHSFLGERLSIIDGVAKVFVFGNPFAVRVRVDPQKLAARQIGINQVAQGILNQNVNLPLGSLFGKYEEFTLSADGQLTQAERYESIIIKNQGNAFVRIKDVGYALDSLLNDKQYIRYLEKGKEENSVFFGIQLQPGYNAMSVIGSIQKLIPGLKESLPKSTTLHTVFDKSDFIKEAIEEVEWTLLFAFVLVITVIYACLGNARNTLIPALALPLSIFGTFAVLGICGYSIDILSLLGITLCVGFLIDDAIVVLENIARHKEKGKSSLQAAIEGSKEISLTVLSMTFSLATIFFPLFFMGGVVGKLFHEFAVVMLSSILISGFVSISLTPMLCAHFMRSNALSFLEKKSIEVHDTIIQFYKKSLHALLPHFGWVTLSGGVLCLLTLLLFFWVPTDFIPPDDIGAVQLFIQTREGTSPAQMQTYQKQINKRLNAYPHIDLCCSISSYPDNNKGFVFIKLKNHKQRPSLLKVIQELKTALGDIPGVDLFFKPYPLLEFQAAASTTKASYQYTLQGLEAEALYTSSKLFVEALKQEKGFTQVSSDLELKQPHLHLEILRDKASSLEISSHDIEQALSLAFGNLNLSPINLPENQYYAVLEVEPRFYESPDKLSQIYLHSPQGNLVPLSGLVHYTEEVGPLNINRVDGLIAVNIFFDLEDCSLGQAVTTLSSLAHKILPVQVKGSLQGTANVFKSSFANLNFLLLITLMLVYIILGILYEDFFHPFTVLSTIPPAAFGGIITLSLFGLPLSLYAFVGLMLLLGIVMKNGIILIDVANAKRKEGATAYNAILEACTVRLRPILMTTFAALMGALPIAMGIGGLTAQARIPLGLVIVGGLLLSQLVTLYLTPSIYLLLEKGKEELFSHPFFSSLGKEDSSKK